MLEPINITTSMLLAGVGDTRFPGYECELGHATEDGRSNLVLLHVMLSGPAWKA
jgi:hypothetical protein